jgi:hypothetical protein
MSDEWILRVHDQTLDAPRGLIGVETLIRCVLAELPEAAHSTWTVRRGAWGQGEFVCSVEDALQSRPSHRIALSSLLAALDARESFNDVVLEVEGMQVSIAVVDSTFLQLTGTRNLVDACSRHFSHIEAFPSSEN